MNQRIFDMARQSGATDEKGSRAEHVFCFTKDELKAFAELIIAKCIEEAGDPADGLIKGNTWHDGVRASVLSIKQHFGVENG